MNLAQNLVISRHFLAFLLAKTEPAQFDPGWPNRNTFLRRIGGQVTAVMSGSRFFCGKCTQRCIYFLKTEIYRSLVNVCKCYKLLRWIWFSEVKFQKNNKFCTHFLNLTPPKTNVTETTFTNHLGRFVSPSSKVTGDSPAIAMLVFWRFLEGICCLWLFMAVVNLPRPPLSRTYPLPEIAGLMISA